MNGGEGRIFGCSDFPTYGHSDLHISMVGEDTYHGYRYRLTSSSSRDDEWREPRLVSSPDETQANPPYHNPEVGEDTRIQSG
ncbi:MAG: hypothetical protein RLQ12_20220 [Cyclobacteriaceae bacterium]